jgi:DNA topoisomerase-1
MTNLVIVESPAKCSKIQGFLGQGWKVIASLGHVRRLKEELDAIGLDKNFEASWEWIKEKSKAIALIKEAAKSATRVYLASDDDREGEMIAYSVCLLLKLSILTTPRAVFHEITETAVKAAIQSPRILDMNKVNAAQARTMLDMMVGFTISPLLWKTIGPSLSAGRCQTPALRLVVEKEKEIKSFSSTSSWKIQGKWSTATNQALQWDAHLTDDLEDAESAINYLELRHDQTGGTILKVETKPWTESPPLPLITSTLQQQASSLFKSAPKETMRIAQRLYEAGHITYMRTDKAILSEEARTEAQTMVKSLYGPEYIGQSIPKSKTKSSTKANNQTEVKAQEAHEAIRPTHLDLKELPENEEWTYKERKIYHLVWLRAIQSVMANVQGDQRTAHFVADGDDSDDFQWRATWRKTNFQGWRRAATKETTEDSEATAEESTTPEAQWSLAQSLKEGTKLSWCTLFADPHETRAPQRYTEATLIRELEHRGIGRPSTFASLISTILDKKYVEEKSFEGREVQITKYRLSKPNQWPPEESQTRQKLGGEKDRLSPTPLGQSVLDYLLEHFGDLFEYGFTAKMESSLDAIANQGEDWKNVLRNTWDAYKERYASLKQTEGDLYKSTEMRRVFEDGLVAIQCKKGPLLLRESSDGDKAKTIFYGWPEGTGFKELTEEAAKAFVESKKAIGEYEGHSIVRKTGKFGPYVEWNGKRVSCKEEDTLETILEKLKASTSASTSANPSVLKKIGDFEIRKGPYGPYMFKCNLFGDKRKFVSVPESLPLETLTEKECNVIYQEGLKEKERSGGGGRGRGRGRGGFRGRGRGQ